MGCFVWTFFVITAMLGIYRVWGEAGTFAGTAAAFICVAAGLWAAVFWIRRNGPLPASGGVGGASSSHAEGRDSAASAGGPPAGVLQVSEEEEEEEDTALSAVALATQESRADLASVEPRDLEEAGTAAAHASRGGGSSDHRDGEGLLPRH